MKAAYWLPSCLVAPWLRIGYLYNGSLAAMLLPGLPVGLPSCFQAPYISVVAPLLPTGSVFQSKCQTCVIGWSSSTFLWPQISSDKYTIYRCRVRNLTGAFLHWFEWNLTV